MASELPHNEDALKKTILLLSKHVGDNFSKTEKTVVKLRNSSIRTGLLRSRSEKKLQVLVVAVVDIVV